MGLYGLPPLREDQIRLVHIEKQENVKEIRCAVSIHLLGNKTHIPKFSALSYTWGPCHRGHYELRRLFDNHSNLGIGVSETIPQQFNNGGDKSHKTQQIVCNDESVDVTENFHDFLCYWTSSQNQSRNGYLWIDALCIDQVNTSERSHQVNIMGRIYTAASQVLIWLGPEDDSTGLAYDLMERLSSLTDGERSALTPHEVSTGNESSLLDLAKWRALSQLFARTWFSRAWIIQKAVFAKSCVVICGSHTIAWENLARIPSFLATSNWTTFLKDPTYFQDIESKWHNTPARLAATKRTRQNSHNDSLLYTLIRARPSVCENPKDKVYSQLGLGQADIFPDYSCSVADVYVTAAEYILNHSDNLLLLTCVEGADFHNPAYNLPSWVPDWSMPKFTGLRMTGYEHFNTAGIRPRKCSLLTADDKRILRVEAAKLDDIVETCERKKNIRHCLHSSTLWQLISKLDSTLVTKHGTQSREEIVWRTLMTNRGSVATARHVQYPAPDALEPSFRNWILWRYAVAVEEPTTFPIPSTSNNFLPPRDELEAVRRRAADDPTYLAALAQQASLFDLHYSHAMLQRPFRTKEGYFGIGTQCLREGDSVWIASGCRVPIILRRINGSERYRLVGGTYVHGCMDGEALDRTDATFEMVSLE